MKNVLVIGGGAAGMMAAYSASYYGAKTILLEKNEKPGKKLFITGKGRCNLTNDCEPDVFFKNVISNSKFLYSAYYTFDSQAVMRLFEEEGLELKTERGLRVFPRSDHSSDVITKLKKLLDKNNVDIHLNTVVTSIGKNKVYTTKGIFDFDALIIATGGISYPLTGSTGDGYKFAADMGHEIITTDAGLVPLETLGEDALRLQGLSLKNVSLTLNSGGKRLFKEQGEMLFTHFGISGPLVLSASSYLGNNITDDTEVVIDLKPALSNEELDKRVQRDFEEFINKDFRNSLDKLLPSKMIPIIIERTGIPPEKKVHDINREERKRLVLEIKNMSFKVKNKRPVSEAIITKGGISTKQINPSTMESKISQNIYFAGEVIDVDALTGGFNLQIAWCTGYLAGMNAATKN